MRPLSDAIGVCVCVGGPSQAMEARMRREIEAKIALKAEKEAQKIARLRRKEAVQAMAAEP